MSVARYWCGVRLATASLRRTALPLLLLPVHCAHPLRPCTAPSLSAWRWHSGVPFPFVACLTGDADAAYLSPCYFAPYAVVVAVGPAVARATPHLASTSTAALATALRRRLRVEGARISARSHTARGRTERLTRRGSHGAAHTAMPPPPPPPPPPPHSTMPATAPIARCRRRPPTGPTSTMPTTVAHPRRRSRSSTRLATAVLPTSISKEPGAERRASRGCQESTIMPGRAAVYTAARTAAAARTVAAAGTAGTAEATGTAGTVVAGPHRRHIARGQGLPMGEIIHSRWRPLRLWPRTRVLRQLTCPRPRRTTCPGRACLRACTTPTPSRPCSEPVRVGLTLTLAQL